LGGDGWTGRHHRRARRGHHLRGRQSPDRLFGRGAHGSRPQTSIDPVVMAAATVMRLQTIVSRELAAAVV
jgi:metal-dependent amidase/aminoacylase/carboxypeptidase family protein